MSHEPAELAPLTATLQRGLALSKQGSYDRRMPDKAALVPLREALKGLRDLAGRQPTAEVLRALSLAEESLLHYPKAAAALERAMSLSPQRDRNDLKRLARVKDQAAKWSALGITPKALDELGASLDAALRQQACDHTLRHTQAWLASRPTKPADKTLSAFKRLGGACDCEVLANVV